MVIRTIGSLFLVLVFASSGSAQERPRPQVEGGVGYLGFVDEALIDHLALHGAAKFYVTSRLAIGPEVAWLRGPGIDRDWVVTGNLTVDLVRDHRTRPRAAVPYVVVGGGFMTSQLQVGTGPYRTSEGALTAGVGVRIAAGEQWFVSPEFRTGWEPHLRYGVSVGRRW